MKSYVSSVIEKDNKFLLVREGKDLCFGKWNLPSGHIEDNEYIFDAAIREIKEETNQDAKLDGLIQIYNNMFRDFYSVAFIFSAKLNNSNITKFDDKEILENKWFSFEEIKNMKDELMDKDYILSSLEKYNANQILPLETIVIR